MPDPSPARVLPLLLRELRRRGVLRAASLYVVGAWAAIQACDVILPAFGISDRVVAAVVLLAVLGFPVVVIVSWVYRVGMKREDVPAEALLVGAKLHVAAGLALVLGLALLATTAWVTLRPGEEQPTAPETAGLDHVAVLYFTDLTRDSAQAYLGAALTGALIDHLDDVEGLTVISRPGVAPYRAHPVAPDSLARALGVGILVDGSVLQVGGRVRVEAELIEAQTGRLLAGIRVDRHAAAPLALVDAVVAEVADSLLSHLGRETRLRHWQAGTSNPDAWTLLQRAVGLIERSASLHHVGEPAAALAELDAADSLLARAERLDRNYLDAVVQRAHVAQRRAMLLARGEPAAMAGALLEGEAHASRVLARGRHAGAYEVRGLLRELRYVFSPPADSAAAAALLASAEQDLHAAVRLEPRRPAALQGLSSVLDARGAFGQALQYLEEAYRVDAFQQNADMTVNRLFTINFELGDDEAAERWCAELRRRTGVTLQSASCALQLAAWAKRPGRVAAARALADSAMAADPLAVEAGGRQLLDVLVAGVMARAGARDSAHALLERLRAQEQHHPELPQLEAGVRVLLGEYDVATSLLREYRRRSTGALLAGSRRFAMLPANPLAPARRAQ